MRALSRLLALSLVGGLASTSGCSCDGGGDSDNSGGGNAGTLHSGSGAGSSVGGSTGQFTGSGGSGGSHECVNLECKQVVCSTPGTTTTVSGTVYDPSGTLPLYNVAVYVPNAPVDAIPDGLTCDQCGASLSGSPLISTLTDTHGNFKLENVPVGENIPLVMQVGKWRRQIVVPTVAECVDTALADPQVTRLPRSSAEGDLPRIALTTGSSDPLFCLLRRLGIDDSEFGVAGSAARIQFFRGANGSNKFDDSFGASPGATFPDGPTTLWENGWDNYDIVMLSCEGSELPGPKDGHRAAMRDYLGAGGRVFATHYHYNWFQGDAPADLKSIATFTGAQNDFDGLVDIDQTFPKGMALAEWMDFVAGQSPFGQFNVVDGRQHTETLDPAARVWVTHQNSGNLGKRTEYFSFNSPIGAAPEDQCGRMVFSDIHVSAGAGNPDGKFPSACSNSPLSEQEKALIFMLFDLSACVIPDDQPPCPPGVQNCGGPTDPACGGTCINGCCNVVPD